ncbi:MAG TPA: hypothetical protein VN817_07605 [Solirubrobacteraceae bacterium]|nr:hypothetical protein [Solirubrobacteraceae bacterium]
MTGVYLADIVREMIFRRRGSTATCATLFGAALALAASGCGGKSAAPSSTVKSASTAAATRPATAPVAAGSERHFIARADAICRKANVRLGHAGPKGGTTTELVAGVVENEKIERTTVAELRRLTSPPALAPAWAKLLGDRRDLANGLGNLAAAVKRRDQTVLPSMQQSKEKLHADLTEVASAAGFKDCAKIGG